MRAHSDSLRQIMLAMLPFISGSAWQASASGVENGFASPVQLSINGLASQASVLLDDTGSATALWSDGAPYISRHVAGGSWTPAAKLGRAVVRGTAFGLLQNGAFAASIVSYGAPGTVWVADSMAGGRWTRAAVIASGLAFAPTVSGPSLLTAANAQGDQAVFLLDQSVAGGRLVVIRRTAGAGWGAPEIVQTGSSSTKLLLVAASMSATGDVLLAWQSYVTTCGRVCHDTSFALSVSRAARGAASWTASAPLTAPAISPYTGTAGFNQAGLAVVLSQVSGQPLIAANTQASLTDPWSASAIAFKSAALPQAVIAGSAAAPLGGFAFAMTKSRKTQDTVAVVDGKLLTNHWRRPADLSAGLKLAPGETSAMLAGTPAGANMAVWTDRDGSGQVSARSAGAPAWSPAQQALGTSPCYVAGVQCTLPAAAGLNASGQMVVLFDRTDPNHTAHNLLAVTE